MLARSDQGSEVSLPVIGRFEPAVTFALGAAIDSTIDGQVYRSGVTCSSLEL
jgi:hypothetical protein